MYITYRNDAGGPSHGHRQHAQKLVKIARVVPEISSRSDRHTHRREYHNTSSVKINNWNGYHTLIIPPSQCSDKQFNFQFTELVHSAELRRWYASTGEMVVMHTAFP